MDRNYIFHWRTGEPTKGHGSSAADALNKLGYGAGSIAALDYWEQVADNLGDIEGETVDELNELAEQQHQEWALAIDMDDDWISNNF